MASVAFIGTGLLGSGMVEAMLRRGDRLTVWNRTEAKARPLGQLGAAIASSPEEAVRSAERVHLALPDDAVVDSMVERIRSQVRTDAVIVDHSTTAPALTKTRVERCAQRGVPFLHAPVFMTPQMCRESKGMMLVSGPTAVYERVRDELARMTGEVWYFGERGNEAAAYKLFGNSMIFVVTAGISDVFAIARGAGIAPADAVALFSKLQVGGVIPSRGDKMAKGDFQATFELTMARKDMRLMLETAAGQPLSVLPAIAKRMDEAIAGGHGADDLGSIAAAVVSPSPSFQD